MVASIEKSSTLRFRKQKNKIVIRHSDKDDMNPSIPDEGEVVYATDTNELYIGDGLSKVEDLSPISGGGSGTSDYNALVNKPSINGNTLSGNKTSANLGLASASQGAKADTALQPGANISELTNNIGYITGIDSSDVSEALGYTPYSSANPNGYVTKDVNNLTNYTTTNDLATVALTGDYEDLQNKPYIPEGVIVDQTYDATSTNAQSGTAVAEAVANKVSANTAITGATKCKITYDSKGLVTAGADLTASDIPSLDISKINGVTASTTELNYVDGVTSSIQTQLNGKVSSVSSANKVYATDNNSSDTTISYTTANTASTIVQRDSNSQINVNLTPSDNTHAASKKYVDDKFDTAITEAVVFQGIVANQTLLPSSGNTNGDLYWITEFVSPAPTGMTVGGSGAAIWNAKLATPQWQYTEDAIYQPDDATIELNANAKLSVKLSNVANNSLTTDANGLIVDISGKLDKNNAITGATKCKITYDSKGLVTAGADITLSDVSDVTASATEVNVLDGITASTTELNYTDGVTSNIQTQLNGKLQQFSDMPTDLSLYNGQIVQFTGPDSTYYDATTQTNKPVKRGYFYLGTYDSMNDSMSWDQIDVQPEEIPSQTGQSGKFLTTDGSSLSWATVSSGSSTLASLTDVSLSTPTDGQILTYDDMNGVWYNGNAPKEVKVAIYGTTTFATISAWVNAGNYVICDRNGTYGSLFTIDSSAVQFAFARRYSDSTGVITHYICTSGNVWSYGNLDIVTKPAVVDFYVDSSTGAITCTFTMNPTNKSVHTVIGNTSIAGTWSGSDTSWVFTPTTADDILDNANGFVVTVS